MIQKLEEYKVGGNIYHLIICGQLSLNQNQTDI